MPECHPRPNGVLNPVIPNSYRKAAIAVGFLEATVLSEGFSSVEGFYIQVTSKRRKKDLVCAWWFVTEDPFEVPKEEFLTVVQILLTLFAAF